MTSVTRRSFLQGMAGILAAGVAPAAIGSNILMPVKKLWTPSANERQWFRFSLDPHSEKRTSFFTSKDGVLWTPVEATNYRGIYTFNIP